MSEGEGREAEGIKEVAPKDNCSFLYRAALQKGFDATLIET